MAPRSRSPRLFTPGRILSVGAILVVVVLGLEVFSSNDYIFLPDRAHPVAPLVQVAGGHEPKNGGGIYFVDVIVRKATLLEELLGGLHSGATLYPASEIVPPGVTSAEEETADLSEMRTSQQVAAAVALRALGRKVTTTPVGAVIDAIEPGFPAAGRLEPTDVIVAIDGKAVHSPADVERAMAGRKIGSTVRFTILRNGAHRVIALHTVAAEPGSKRAVVGVELDATPDVTIHLPIHVSIDAHGVGGPSAGLAFALEVLQQLGRNVDRGHKIAATGEIYLDGQVGPIGGIEQKTIGAREAGVDAFLVPAGQNAIDARKYAHGLRIIPVKSFQQALHELATLPLER